MLWYQPWMEQLQVNVETVIYGYFVIVLLAPQDYSSVNQSFIIPLLSSLYRFSIFITDDRVLEEDEQFSVLLQLPTNGLGCGITLGSTAVATVNIQDNDGMLLTVNFSVYHLI